uniref:Kinesin-like protein n=2 Tax=Parascaris univalens TaxID=6257 RepID=A0A915BAN3_PARUN
MGTPMKSRKRVAATAGSASKPKRVDTKEAVEVLCRICPFSSTHGAVPCAVAVDDERVKLIAPSSSHQVPNIGVYKFAYVFNESDTQSAIFERAALDLVEDVVRGKNSLLFTYGVSGSGKTYTMTGDVTEATMGILPRTLDVLFNSLPNLADKYVFRSDRKNGYVVMSELESALSRRMIASQPVDDVEHMTRYVEHRRVSGACIEMIYAVFVSYVEIYNDVCYDLLADPVTRNDGIRVLQSKELRTDARNTIYVDDIVEVEVGSSDEALKQFFKGEQRRSVADTLLNKNSSRSHSIFSIRVVMAPRQTNLFYPQSDPRQSIIRDSLKISTSHLSLVDLAGSERSKRTGNMGVRLAETSKINQSLLVLRQCFDKLRTNQRGATTLLPVPYRESKLTYLFKNFFEGSGKVRMIVCINPRPEDYPENLAVMSFAEISQDVLVTRSEQVRVPLCNVIDRRQFLQWISEVDSDDSVEWSGEGDSAVLFKLKSSRDTESLERLRAYYQLADRKRKEGLDEVERRERNFELDLRKVLYRCDMKCVQLEKTQSELQEANEMIMSLSVQLRQIRHENTKLKQELRRRDIQQTNESKKSRLRGVDYAQRLQGKEETISRVRKIIASHGSRKIMRERTHPQRSSSEKIFRLIFP